MAHSIPKPVQDLIETLSRLPGIGPKTAQRLAMHLLQAPESLSRDLVQAVQDLKASTSLCVECWHLTTQNPCAICQDAYRERSVLCVVEDPVDVMAIEKTGMYKGLYHVLHGHLSPIDGIGPDDLKMNALIDRVQRSLVSRDEDSSQAPITEVILSTNPTMEGEATASYLHRYLKPLDVKVTRIARGLPSGANIEYADALTLSRALEGRHEF